MNDTAIWVLSMLISAAIVALVWLFTEMHGVKNRVEELEDNMHQSWDSQDIIRRRVSRVEDEVQKLDNRLDKRLGVNDNVDS